MWELERILQLHTPKSFEFKLFEPRCHCELDILLNLKYKFNLLDNVDNAIFNFVLADIRLFDFGFLQLIYTIRICVKRLTASMYIF